MLCQAGTGRHWELLGPNWQALVGNGDQQTPPATIGYSAPPGTSGQLAVNTGHYQAAGTIRHQWVLLSISWQWAPLNTGHH